MSIESCILSAKKWAKENSDVELNARELEQVGRLLDAAEKLGVTPDEKNRLMSDLVDQKIEADQMKRRASRYLDTINAEQGIANVKANYTSWIEKGHDRLKAPIEAFLADIRGGSDRAGSGSNLDPIYMRSVVFDRYMNFIHNSLTPQDIKILRAEEMKSPLSHDIILEKDAIENKTQEGLTNNETALRIAKGLHAAQEAMLSDVKGVNPYVSGTKDFLFSRSHPVEKAAAVSTEEWLKDYQRDYAGSFLGMTPEEKASAFLEINKQIKAGTYGQTNVNSQSIWEPKGTGESAMSRAGSRTLVATDAESAWRNAAKYGADSLWESYVKQADYQSKTVARIQKGGVNPAENFFRKYNGVLNSLDEEQQAAFSQKLKKFKEAFEATLGAQDNEAHGWEARNAQNLMSVQSAAGLGLHLPRSLNGVQAGITLARDITGHTFVENSHAIATGISEALLKLDGGAEALRSIGGSQRNVARDLIGNLGPSGRDVSLAARIGEGVGTLSLTNRWVTAQKYGLINHLTDFFGAQSGTAFDDLHAKTQDTLQRYNLNDAWSAGVLQKAHISEGPLAGKITPDSIYRLTDDDVKPLMKNASPREAARVRGELATNYGVMLNDPAGLMVGESNSRSRIAAYGTTDINSAWGVAQRFMMQFHQAALIRRQLMERTLQSGGGNSSNIAGVLQHALGSAFLSLTGEAMITLASGKSLPSPTSPQMLTHALNGTGIFGIYGSLLASAFSQPNTDKAQQVLESGILGPATGTLIKTAVASGKTLKGIGQYVAGDETQGQFGGKYWASVIHGVVPGQNLFYAKGALDFMLMNELHTFMGGDGYLEALRQSTEKTSAWPEALGGPGGGQQYTFGGKNFWE